MFKKMLMGVFAFVFALVVAGVITQLSSASMFSVAANGSTITTRTPVVGETVPTRTPGAETVPTRTPEPDAPVLQIVNFIDFEDDISEIIVKLNGEEIAQLPYGDSSEYIYMPIGTFLMEIVAVDEQTRGPEDYLLAFADVTFDMSKEYTAVLAGDAGENQPSQIKLVEDNNELPAAGKVKVRIGHFAPFDSDVMNTGVDVRDEDSGLVLAGLSNVQFGTLSDYIELDAGVEYDLIVTSVNGTVLDLKPVTFAAGEIATIIVNGGGANRPVGAGLVSNLRTLYLPLINRE